MSDCTGVAADKWTREQAKIEPRPFSYYTDSFEPYSLLTLLMYKIMDLPEAELMITTSIYSA